MTDKKDCDNKYEKLLTENRCLKEELDMSKCDLNSLEILNKSYEQGLAEKDIKIAFLEGQIKAFQFCIARGADNDR
jgi:hypothetical protein